MEILWKRAVSVEFRANRSKLYTNCAFRQNFHTRKSGEIMVFYTVHASLGFGSLIQRNIECFEEQTMLFFPLKTRHHCNCTISFSWHLNLTKWTVCRSKPYIQQDTETQTTFTSSEKNNRNTRAMCEIY